MCLEAVYSTASAMACKVCDANQSSFTYFYSGSNTTYFKLSPLSKKKTDEVCYPYVYYMY